MEFNSDQGIYAFNQPPEPKNKYRVFLYGLGFVIILGLLFFGIKFGVAYHKITVENQSTWKRIANIFLPGDQDGAKNPEYKMPQKEEGRIDILVLGIRGEEDRENGGLLADSIMLISLVQKTGQASLISIPRDLYLKIPYINKNEKINSIYVFDLERKAGLSFVKEVISRITGVYVDHAVVVNMQAFQELVDALGGIMIYLEKPFEEPTQWGYPFRLEAGQNILNGQQALYYVRSRYSSSDFDRARRQQQILVALKDKLAKLGALVNPVKINALINVVQKNVKTDISPWELQTLIRLAIAKKDGGLKKLVISTDNLLYDTTIDGAYVLLPRNNTLSEIKSTFADIFNSKNQ